MHFGCAHFLSYMYTVMYKAECGSRSIPGVRNRARVELPYYLCMIFSLETCLPQATYWIVPRFRYTLSYSSVRAIYSCCVQVNVIGS